ncbi:putative ABC multidrug transporter [Aspergillus campestris IBT 28561]|uniref:ABC multidrug transporter n=1 Tax=Aspergillus campestris (strain IBT 28561) TaxID=1392248 RepID=A0A2I1DHC6_ASPC2|nr:putative ABC multidrug transporter [Aspergillus campestris IBT 28561]PKY09269.1 putative ABC multidrug transporter [Aspergillus campestris IBT 28561]
MEHFAGAVQHVLSPPVSDVVYNEFTSALESGGALQRHLWQRRAQNVSAYVATGSLHTVAFLVSCVVLFFSICRHYVFRSCKSKRQARPDDSPVSLEIAESLPFAFAHLAVAIAACVLSWLETHQRASWRQSALMSYMLLLGLLRFCFTNSRYRAHLYRHMNAIAFVALVLEIVQHLSPLAIIGTKYLLSPIRVALLTCLAAVVLIALGTPRPRRPLVRNEEIEELCVEDIRVSPEETCSLFSYYWSYEWVTYVILRGCRKDLTMEDLPPLPSYDEPSLWLKKIQTQRKKGGKTFRTLIRLLKTEIKTMMGWSAATAVMDFVAPFSMLGLLAYLEARDDAIVHPAIWISLLFIGPVLRSLCYQQYIFTATRLLVRVNISLVQDIYQTAMRSHIYDDSIRDSVDRAQKADGKLADTPKGTSKSRQANLTSLMSYDVDAIYNSRDIFYVATASPISTTIALVFLYKLLGWPSLFGVFTLLFLTPLPAFASRKVSRIQQSVMRATDARLSKVSEYLASIRTLKYFGWEHAAIDTINDARKVEQDRLWKRSVYAAAISMAGDLLPLVSLLVTFSAFVIFTDGTLRAPVAFTSVTIMEALRSQFVWLSNVSRYTAQGAESLRRVDRFFESAGEIKRHPEGPLELTQATFQRTPIAAFRLKEVSVSFKHNALNVVTGPTGSGKTTLLLSLLGETILESGSATCPRDVAYVPQAAWLQNDTIRQNVIFYSPFDEARYAKIIDASGLSQDLQQLPAGDLTLVGEKGTSLSGGQKQRVSLARALYSHSPVLLLDDIFSALDTHTTSLVYEKCFRSGLLSDRTVVLVTHLPAALQDAQQAIRLEHGRSFSVETPSILCSASLEPTRCSTPSTQTNTNTDNMLQTQDQIHDAPSEPPIKATPAFRVDESDQTGKLAKEQSATGRVPRSLFFQYMKLFGGIFYAPLAILATIAVQLAYFGITYWLSIWTEANGENGNQNNIFYLTVYGAAIMAFLVMQLTNNLIYQYGGWAAARTMHKKLVTAVLSAPISWFDENPVGRVVNRFGNDMRSIDALIIDWLRMSMENGLRFLLRIASVASIMPIFALPAAIVCTAGFLIGEMYTRAQVSIKRLCSVNYSPIFSHFTDSLSGISVIRARQGMDKAFQKLLAKKLAVHARSAEAQYNCNRWVSVRTDFCAASVSAAAGCVAYFWSGSPGLVGFSLTNAIGFSQTILTLVRTMNELEVELNSFQRVREYCQVEPEETFDKARLADIADSTPASWPTSGRVEFRNVTARYTPDGPDVLRRVSFVAHSGERVGIVGRTGSGKSTLGLLLLRFVNLVSGSVTIDGVDITQLLLHRLRSSVTLIPQEPVLFSGDVQSNLDPFGASSETELQSALSACASIHTNNHDEHDHGPETNDRRNSQLSLQSPVAANGENFSQGQRQVLSLARAMCRRSKVVLLDEATASVDHETDLHMQRVLRDQFPDCTIIAIAHRLRTIMDYDRILVMADGEIVENGSPAELVEKRGVFWDMMRNTGEYEELVGMIRHASSP